MTKKKKEFDYTSNKDCFSDTLKFVTNTAAQTRYEMLEGKQYLVVPMVMLTEGVHEGSSGPLYYPDSELSKSPAVWNHKPVVSYHPNDGNGNAISACSPEVLESRKVGLIMNTTWDESAKKLRAEAWLDEAKLEKVDPRVLEAIKNKQVVEISTGVFTDNEPASGQYNGKPYTAIARNYRPDHLAILYDQRGACSVADGAGLLANQEGSRGDKKRVPAILSMQSGELVANQVDDVSYNNIHSQLMTCLQKKHGVPGVEYRGYIEDIFSRNVVYCNDYSGDTYAHAYEVDSNNKVKLVGSPTKVKRVAAYYPADHNASSFIYEGKSPTANQGSRMTTNNTQTRAERVAAIIKKEKGFTAEHQAYLNEMPEPMFVVLEQMAHADTQPTNPGMLKIMETATGGGQGPQGTATPAVPGFNAAPLTVDQYLATMPVEMQSMIRNALAVQEAEKVRLIGIITANTNNRFTKEYLEKRTLEELTGLASLAAGGQVNNAQQRQSVLMNGGLGGHYGVAAGAVPTTNQQAMDDTPLPLPTIDYSN